MRKMDHSLQAFFLLLAAFASLTKSEKYCRQMMYSSSLGFDCSQSNGIPAYLPNTTVILNVSYCGIESFNGADYKGFPDLELLDLSGNRIEVFQLDSNIREKGFNLPSLKYLNLNSNQLRSLPNFAFALFQNLKTLTLETNQIHDVAFEAFHELECMEEINLGRNKLKVVPKALAQLPSLTKLTLPYNLISTIDMSFFCHFPNLKYLDLSHNEELTAIYTGPYLSLCLSANISLEILDLSYSTIHFIDKNSLLSFESIFLLKFYRNNKKERQNCLLYNQTMDLSRANFEEALLTISDLSSSDNPINNSGLCQSLSLRKLRLIYAVTDNTKLNFDGCFRNLEELTLTISHENQACIHALFVYFPKNLFKDLVSLKKLDFDGLNYIFDSYTAPLLSQLPLLEWLDLSFNYIYHLDEASFHGLTALKYLDLSHNHLTDDCFSETTFIQQQHLLSLKLQSNFLHRIDRLLSSILSLHYLDLSLNFISILQPQVFDRLSDLKELHLGGCSLLRLTPPSPQYKFKPYILKSLNKLVLDHVEVLNFYEESLAFYENLTSLNLVGSKLQMNQDALLSLPRLQSINAEWIKFPYKEYKCKLILGMLRKKSVTEIIASNLFMTDCSIDYARTPNLERLDLSNNKLNTFHFNRFSILPELQTLNLSSNILQKFAISSDLPSLNSIDLKNNMISRPELISFDLLQPTVKFLDLRNNELVIIQLSSSILQTLKKIPNLEELYLDGSSVDMTFSQKENFQLHAIFEKSTELLVLTISKSRITVVQKNFFADLPKLEKLDLSKNVITSLPVDLFRNNLNLVTLNLEGNRLNLVDDYINFVHLVNIENLFLKQEGTLNCDCKAAGFQKWILSRLPDIKFTRDGRLWDAFMCAIPKDTPLLSVNYSQPDCRNMSFRHVFWILLLLLLSFSISVFFLYKYYWVLRYQIYRFQKRCQKYSFSIKHHKDGYLYDVFVSYSGRDLDWVKDELLDNLEPEFNVCIHDRDFLPGEAIVDNIESSICKSRKTLFVVTSNFIKSSWCKFEVRFALQLLFETDQDNILFVLLENLPNSELPSLLKLLINTKTYIEWPTNPGNRNTFWNKLKATLIHSENRCEELKVKLV